MENYQNEGLQAWAGPILEGALVTIEIALLAYAIGLGLGLIGASARLSGWAPLRGLATLYSTLVRAAPELLLIILLYYAGTQALNAGLGALGFESAAMQISGFVTAVGVPSELTLFANGRTSAAQVRLVGEPEAVEQLLGMETDEQ